MKKYFIPLVIVFCINLFSFSVNASASQKEISVSNENELLAAIDNDTHIILTSDYYNLTNCDSNENDKIDIQIDWIELENGGTQPVWSYVIKDVNNLTIEGKSKIVTENIMGAVLSFQRCNNIKIDGLTMGHLKPNDEYHCEGALASAYDCNGFILSNCNLFGCGAEGLYADNVKNIEINSCNIYECTYAGVWLTGDSEAIVNKTDFSNCSLAGGILRIDNSKITCNNCLISDVNCEYFGIKGNLIETFDFDGTQSLISLNNCKIMNNSFEKLTNLETKNLVLSECIFNNNDGIVNVNNATGKDSNSFENSTISDDDSIQVLIDGKKLEFDVQPTIINDRTMVPLRKIFEALGATVEWNGDTQTITSRKNQTTIEMIINNSLMSVNGNVKYLDVPPIIIDGRTLVPVRAISESFGYKVDWLNNVVSITTVSIQ